MKRVLSLILALVMILGTLPMAFAADTSAGEMLQAAGFVAGDENGNLMEDNQITRAELAVLVAELNGVKENAKTYAIAPEFSDVNANDWFGPYVAYAAKEGWFKGDDAGNFNPAAPVSDQVMATVMLRALGYEPAWETAVSEAKAMGLPVDAAAAGTMTRGEAFSTMWGVVNTPKKDSDVALGVELGKIEPAMEEVTELVAEIDEAKAVAANLTEVEFADDVDAAAAAQADNYTIVEKADTTKEVAIVAVTVEGSDLVVLETEALTAGKAYTVLVGDSSYNYTGIKKDTDAPGVDSVKGTDNGVVEVVFEDALLDKATAEDVANYVINEEGTVVKAEMNGDRDTVTLTIEGLTTTKSKKLTVENVASTDGVVMKKVTKSFGPEVDKVAPKIEEVKASSHNNTEVLIEWDDEHGVDQATAEDVSNYSIDGLDIVSAKAIYINSSSTGQDDYYDKVILTTSEQTKSKKYVLEVKYMIDGSTAANATTKVLDEKFTGGTNDDDEPKVTDADARNLTEIVVTFSEENALDASTALDAGNYTFKDDELSVLSVEFDDEDANGNTYEQGETGVAGSINQDDKVIKVILTVEEMEEDESYKLYVNNIADNYGNVMEDKEDENIRISDEVKTYSQLVSANSTSLEEVVVVFDIAVKEDSAEDVSNYVIDGGIGAVKEASLGSDELTVTLTVAKLTDNKTYKVTVNNVENFWGYATEDSVMEFIAANDELDSERPTVDSVDYDFHGQLAVTFSEAVNVGISNGDTTVDADETVIRATKEDNTPIILFATETLEDDTVVIFDAYTTLSGDQGEVVKILDFTNTTDSAISVTDNSMNFLDYDDNDEDFTTANDTFAYKVTVGADSSSDERATVDSANQENGNTIHIVFDREVMVTDGVMTIAYDNDDDGTTDASYDFDIEAHDDDATIVVATKTSGDFPKDEVELHIDATDSDLITDLIGRDVNDSVYKLDVDNDDDSAPELEEIIVVDNKTIKIVFDEKLSADGSYSVINKDDDDSAVSIDTVGWDDNDVRDTVEITFNDTLTTDNYEITISNVKDLAGNKADKDTYSFVGVNNAPANKTVLVKVVNTQEIYLVNNIEDFATMAKSDFTITGTSSETSVTIPTAALTLSDNDADDDLTITIDPEYALLAEDVLGKDMTYKIVITGKTSYTIQTFTGLLDEEEASVTTHTATTITVDTGASYDDDSYTYAIANLDDSTTKTFANSAVAEGDGGTIIFTFTNSTERDTYEGDDLKLIVYPVDSDVTQDAIETITQSFDFND